MNRLKEIILAYLGGSNVITRVPTRGKQDNQSQGTCNDRSRVMCSKDGGRGHELRDAGVLQKVNKGNRFSPGASKRNTALPTPWP